MLELPRMISLPGRWVEAGHVQIGDQLLLVNGKEVSVEEVGTVPIAEKVFNLEIAEIHTYAVGKTGVLVHNSNCIEEIENGMGGVASGSAVKNFDIVDYRPSNPPLQNHHGVLDVWANHNIDNYISRGTTTPTIALTESQHAATQAVFRDWLLEQTGKRVGGRLDWSKVSPQEMQRLTERMFAAADVPQAALREYYRAFHKYIYRGK
jgi:hypothetical protein